MKRIIGLILLLTLGTSLLFALTSCDVKIAINYKDADKYTAGERSFTSQELDGIEEIELEWIEGDAEISYHDEDFISVKETTSRTPDEHELLHTYFDGHTLHIKYAESGTWNIKHLSKSLKVMLPRGLVIDKLELDTVSANAKLLALEADECDVATVSGDILFSDGTYSDITASITSGKLEIEGSSVKRSIEAELVSGDADIAPVGALLNIDVSSVSGKIELNCERADDIELESTSGNVRAELGALALDLNISTVSGNARLIIPEDSSFSLEFDTVSGSFDCEIPTTKNGDRYIAGKGEHNIEVETTSGNLKLEKK